MNEPLDPLEAELKAFQPRHPSTNLRDRIAAEIDQLAAPASLRPPWWTAGLAIGLIAASLLAGYLMIRTRPEAVQEQVVPMGSPALVFDTARPTYWTYQQAFGRSSEALDDALDRHARLSAPNALPTPPNTFTRFDTHLLMNGEL